MYTLYQSFTHLMTYLLFPVAFRVVLLVDRVVSLVHSVSLRVELLWLLLVVIGKESIIINVMEVLWRFVEDFGKAAKPFRALNENLVGIRVRSDVKIMSVLGEDESIIPLLVYN